MNKTLLAVLLWAPLTVFASGHLDVIKFTLNEDCTLAEYLEIKADFDTWAAQHGYSATVAVPLQNADLEHYYWLGRSDNAAAFGNAWDVWRDAQANPDSEEAQLASRFAECSMNVSRTGYDLY